LVVERATDAEGGRQMQVAVAKSACCAKCGTGEAGRQHPSRRLRHPKPRRCCRNGLLPLNIAKFGEVALVEITFFVSPLA